MFHLVFTLLVQLVQPIICMTLSYKRVHTFDIIHLQAQQESFFPFGPVCLGVFSEENNIKDFYVVENRDIIIN